MSAKTKAKTPTVQRFIETRNKAGFDVNKYRPERLPSQSGYVEELQELCKMLQKPISLTGRSAALKLLNFLLTTHIDSYHAISDTDAVIAERMLISRNLVERYQMYEFLFNARRATPALQEQRQAGFRIIAFAIDAVLYDASNFLEANYGVLVVAKQAFDALMCMMFERNAGYVGEFFFDTFLAGLYEIKLSSTLLGGARMLTALLDAVHYPVNHRHLRPGNWVIPNMIRVTCLEDSRSIDLLNPNLCSVLGGTGPIETKTLRHYDMMCSYICTSEFLPFTSMLEAFQLLVDSAAAQVLSFERALEYTIFTELTPPDSATIGDIMTLLKNDAGVYHKLHLMFVLINRRHVPATTTWAEHDRNLFAHLIHVFMRDPEPVETKPVLQLSRIASTPAVEALVGRKPMSAVHPRNAGIICARRCLSVAYPDLSLWYHVIYEAMHAPSWSAIDKLRFARRFLFTAKHEYHCKPRTVSRRKEMAGILLMLSSVLDKGFEDDGDFAVFRPACAVGYAVLSLREGLFKMDGDGSIAIGVLRWLCRYD